MFLYQIKLSPEFSNDLTIFYFKAAGLLLLFVGLHNLSTIFVIYIAIKQKYELFFLLIYIYKTFTNILVSILEKI